ncbi:MAG: ATP-binding protein [Syntrophobacterales bacterium]|nr:ATP-binding protein [Syntrophobacterales bacterium]
MRRRRLVAQLFPSYLMIAALALLAVTWYVGRAWRASFLAQTATDLKVRADLVIPQFQGLLSPLQAGEVDRVCKELGRLSATRLTVILSSGRVVGDSDNEPAKMDNHGDRPEVRQALKGKIGVSTRHSYTEETPMMYVAAPLMEQDRVAAVVRASLPVAFIGRTLNGIYFKIALGGMGAALLAALLSLAMAHRLSRPLEEMKRVAQRFAQGDLRVKVPVPLSDEPASLAEALNYMAEQLDQRIRTITRQRQEQDAVLASMVEGVMAVDHQERIITLNQAGARLLGVDPDAARQRPIAEVVRHPDLQNFVDLALASPRQVEGEIIFRDAAPDRLLQIRGTPLRDAQGNAFGALIVLNDVTRLRRLEQARRDFVANVSHELKTPITSIKGFVETLLDGAIQEPDNAVNFLNIIARHADRLNAIIDDLLSLSRIEQDSDRGKIALAAGHIKEVLRKAVQACRERAAAKDIAIDLDCPEELATEINAPLLEQAVVNLIDNAVKYSPAGRPVRVEARVETGEVLILVKDQGSGIAPEHLSRLFERFYRVDPGRSRKVGGTGLGLAIVKHIAQAHGGYVTLQSAPGKGSTFFIHLPQV